MTKGTGSLKFEVVTKSADAEAKYSDGCSGSRSDCCTRVCTRVDVEENQGSLAAWDRYLEVNAGVVQY